MGAIPHAGLGLSGYVQFSSPIRRYGDLLAHYQVGRRQCSMSLSVKCMQSEGAVTFPYRYTMTCRETRDTMMWSLWRTLSCPWS